MTVEVPRDAIVIRFTPTDPERVLARAERDHRLTGRYALSVFADVPRSGETSEQLIERLLAAAELSHIDPDRNPKYFVCSSAAELLDRGFTFVKDGYEGEVNEHYSVDIGSAPTVEQAKAFTSAFDDERRR